MNQQHTEWELVACTVQPGIWPVWGVSDNAVGERDAPRRVSPPAPSLSVAGSWWQATVARHGSLGCQEMAIITCTPWLSEPLSPLHKVPLYVLRDISQKCVHGCREEGIRDRSWLYKKGSRYRDQYRLRKRDGESFFWLTNTFHFNI